MSLHEEVINNVYKNAHIALQSISNIMPEASCKKMKEELEYEHDGYEKLIGEISAFMKSKNIEPKDVNFMKKAMLFTSIKMNALGDDSCSHHADMMVKGTVMGICELRQIITRSNGKVDPEYIEYAQKLLSLEEEFEQRLKQLL